MPQTFSTLDERLRALDLVRKRESTAAWKLMLGILPRGHDISSPTPMPRWRDLSVDQVESASCARIGRGVAAVSELCASRCRDQPRALGTPARPDRRLGTGA